MITVPEILEVYILIQMTFLYLFKTQVLLYNFATVLIQFYVARQKLLVARDIIAPYTFRYSFKQF